MGKQELAAKLNGREYTDEMTRAEEAQAKQDGLVVVFGASDDLMEFRGAINDEFGCYDGGTVLLDTKGLLPERESIDNDDELEDFFTRRKTAHKIAALWKESDYSWTYMTTIPHATFDVMEGSKKYCRGIVFNLSKLDNPEVRKE
jgi:hypothetical protein